MLKRYTYLLQTQYFTFSFSATADDVVALNHQQSICHWPTEYRGGSPPPPYSSTDSPPHYNTIAQSDGNTTTTILVNGTTKNGITTNASKSCLALCYCTIQFNVVYMCSRDILA